MASLVAQTLDIIITPPTPVGDHIANHAGNTPKTDDQIIDAAVEAAAAAVKAAKEQMGGVDRGWCGFGWVELRPGTSKLARRLKERGLGSRGWNGGVHIWNPGKSNWQNVDVTYAGAAAFAKVLRDHGYDARAMSRLD